MERWTTLAALGAMALVGTAVPTVHDEVHPPVRPAGLEAHETHAATTLLGQFRTSISSWLWLRTDLYLHNGVQMRLLSDAEVQAGVRGLGSSDNHDGKLHDDSKITTVVPPAERDFRGWAGDVERATQAYKDMRGHDHNDPKSALPLFRLMTWLDPQFIPGWTVGAHVVVRGNPPGGFAKASALLNEGLRHNPERMELLVELGHLQATRGRQMRTAQATLERAVAAARRVPDGADEEVVDSMREAYRWAALVHREVGDLDRMAAVAREGERRLPDDRVLRRLAYPAPTPWPLDRQRAWYQALDAGR